MAATLNPGQPPSMSLEAAERALLEAVRRQPGAQRIASLNLLIRAGDDADAQRLARELEPVLAAHPARVLLLTPGLSPAREWRVRLLGAMERPAGGVHAEILHLRGGLAEDAGAAAMPLLRSGLPVCLWWRGASPAQAPGFAALAQLADRVLYDSVELGAQGDDWRALSRQMRAQPHPSTAIDLVWPRMTRWRRLLAQAAETPTGLRLWAGLDRIHFQACAGQPPLNAAALMLAGWLISRLGWQLGRRPAAERFQLRTPRHDEAAIEFRALDCGQPETIFYGLRLEHSRAGLRLELERNGSRIQAEFWEHQASLGASVGAFPPTDALAALAQELQLCHPDQVFEEAQAAALRLLEQPVEP